MDDPTNPLFTALLKIPIDALADHRLSGWVICPATGRNASIDDARQLIDFLAEQSRPSGIEVLP